MTDPAAAFDETPPAQPEPERKPSPLCRCVDGAPTMPCGRIPGAYKGDETEDQARSRRAREDTELRGLIRRWRVTLDGTATPRYSYGPPDPLAKLRASVAELRAAATTGKRADVLAAVAKLEDALR